MILIAAIALGIAWTKFQLGGFATARIGALMNRHEYELLFHIVDLPPWKGILFQCAYWLGWSAPVLASVSVGVFVMGLIRAKRIGRRVFRQAGLSTCFAVTAALALEVARQAIRIFWVLNYYYSYGVRPVEIRHFRLRDILRPTEIGMAVFVVWVVLITSQRFRCEPTLIDRFGRCIGAYWITTMCLIWAAAVN